MTDPKTTASAGTDRRSFVKVGATMEIGRAHV